MQLRNERFGGSMVALVTPMHPDGSVDWQKLEALVNWHIEQGTDGIVSVGTTGESATLSVEEHSRVIERTVELVDKRIPIIAGAGGNATAEAIRLAEHARQVGADASLQVCPYYNKPTQEGLYQHFKAVAEAVDMPHILYNVPGRTVIDMQPETTARLAAIDNIVAIKEAEGSIERIRALVEAVDGQLDVFCGEDGSACETMLAGGKGNISVVANVVPNLMHRMCDAAVAGRSEQARQMNTQLAPLYAALFVEANPIPVKWAMQDLEWIRPGIRLPLTELDEAYRIQVRQSLATLLD